MILSTPSLTIRPWAPTDVDTLVRIADDPRISANLRDRFPSPYTRADGEAFLAFLAAQNDAPTTFAITVAGEPAGGIGLNRFEDVSRNTAELGYWLGVSYWGRGLATEAVEAMTRYGFEELGLLRIQAGVYDWNPASARVLEKAGYTLEGRLRKAVVKRGRVGDLLMYARVREDS